jgi:hypothetical protein
MMDIKDYAREVEKMQSLQAEYWKRRDVGILQHSKAQEVLVKKMTREILNPSLFGDDE